MKYIYLLLVFCVIAIPSVDTVQARKSIRDNGARSRNKFTAFNRVNHRSTQTNLVDQATVISVTSNTGKNTTNNNTSGVFKSTSGSNSTNISIQNRAGTNYAEDEICCGWGCQNPEPTPIPTPNTCEEKPGWANSYTEFNQGSLKNGNPITDPLRMDPNNIVGAVDGKFFSLGKDGSISVHFNRPVKNVAGVDLSFHEVTNDRGDYPEEKLTVEVSSNGSDWYTIGEVSNNDGGDGIGYLDFDSTGLATISYVRVTDATDYDLHNDQADGYDLDAIDVTLLSCPEIQR